MMKWRVQRKARKAAQIDPEEIKASLDYLDSIIEEYVLEDNRECLYDDVLANFVPEFHSGPFFLHPESRRSDLLLNSSDSQPSQEESQQKEAESSNHRTDDSRTNSKSVPPQVPTRSSRTRLSNHSSREYPLSPPPRRRYTSPERRMRAALEQNGGASQPTKPPQNRQQTPINCRSSSAEKKPTSSSIPETSGNEDQGTFKRKSEFRNSIHVDLNVSDVCLNNTLFRITEVCGPASTLSRSRSLRGPKGGRTKNDVPSENPPPLPPRKSKLLEHCPALPPQKTFFVAGDKSAVVSPNQQKSVANGLSSSSDGVPRAYQPVSKIFEPVIRDMPVNCYNVYNVPTGKISSSLQKPSGKQGVEQDKKKQGKVEKMCVKEKMANNKENCKKMTVTTDAEKLIGKFISKCKATAVSNVREKKSAPKSERQPRSTRLQRHSKCKRCVVAISK